MRYKDAVKLQSGHFWYEGPFLECVGLSDQGCDGMAPLPYDNLPQTDYEQLLWQDVSQLEWPSDEWTIFFGCRDCGLVANRGRANLVSEPIPKESEGRFRNDATLHCVEFPCANTSCKVQTKMYVDISDGSVEGLLRDMKEMKFHGSLLCGHPIKPVPSPLCKVLPVTTRLW